MKHKKDFNSCSGKKYDGMMGRCYRETDASYKRYGERGIKVCSSWIENIGNFRSWLMAELFRNGISEEEFIGNSKIYQLDRKDPNGHYTPENCRIVNPQENARNKSKPLKIVESAEGNKHKI